MWGSTEMARARYARGMIRGVLVLVLAWTAGPGCTSPTCSDKIAAMRRTLAQIPAGAGQTPAVAVGRAFALPMAARGEPVRGQAPVLRVRADGVQSIDDQDPDDDRLDDVMTQLASRLDRGDGERAVYLALEPDGRVNRERLLEVASLAPLRLLVRVPVQGPSTPAGEAALAAVRGATDPSARASAMVAAMDRAGGRCEALDLGFHYAGAAISPEDRQALLINTAIEGAEACGCDKVDVEALTALTWYALTGDDPGLRWLPLELDVAATRLVPADATAAELARIVAEDPRVGFAPH
jgi:hypothetical protein